MSQSSSVPGSAVLQSPPTMSGGPGHADGGGGLPRPSRQDATQIGAPHGVGGPPGLASSKTGHNAKSIPSGGAAGAVGSTSQLATRQRSLVNSPGSSEATTPIVDPLSRHILQRTGTDPNVRVKKESLVEEQLNWMKELSTSARSSPANGSPGQQRSQSTLPDPQPNSAQRSTQQQSPQSQQQQSSSPQTQHPKRKASSRSFLSRLIGIRSDETDSDDESLPDAGDRMEGNNAQAFSQPLEGKLSHVAPNYIRVRSRSIATRDFSNLFLAQELQTPEAASTQGR